MTLLPEMERTLMHRERPLDFWLTLVTIAALFVPIWGILLEPSKLIRVPVYLLVLGTPALLLVTGVLIYAKLVNRVLLNRFLVGYGAGFVGSGVVHLFVAAGLLLGFSPNLPATLGKMMLGVPLSQPATIGIIAAGMVYHYLLNGAAWGAVYSLVFGKTLWWIGAIYGLAVAAILMVSPAFYSLGFRAMGLGQGAVLLISIVVAHFLYGAVIGLIVHRYAFPEVGVEGAKAIKPTYA